MTKGKPLHEIFGSLDDLKFPSLMTLFCETSADKNNTFRRALGPFCERASTSGRSASWKGLQIEMRRQTG
jgi:uncharacterized protein (DUF1810 family)